MFASPSPAESPRLTQVWWLDPANVFLCLVLPTALAAVITSPRAYDLYETTKHIGWNHFALICLGTLAFVVSCGVGRATSASGTAISPDIDTRLHRAVLLAGFLTVFGYVVWILVAMKRGFSLGAMTTIFNLNEDEAFRLKEEVFTTIPGVTTCMQFGQATVILAMLPGMWRRPWVKPLLAALLVFSLFRALVASERLALIELAVPVLLLGLRVTLLGKPVRPWVQRGLQLLPIVGVAGLIVFFGTFEYFRSWRYHKDKFDSIVDFTLWRLGGYYVTPWNNSAMFVDQVRQWPLPYHTVESLWMFPLVKGSYQTLTQIDPREVMTRLLYRHAQPELNNEGGLLAALLDFGLIGYALYWSAIGFISGRVYDGFRRGTLAGFLLFPIFYISALEVPRLIYLSSTRTFPSLVLLATVALIYTSAGRANSSASVTTPGSRGFGEAPCG